MKMFTNSFSCNRVTFIARDIVSFKKINELKLKLELRLHADLVTYFIQKPLILPNPPMAFIRKLRIACILRNDLEKKINETDLKTELNKNSDIIYDVFDTNVRASVWLIDLAKRQLLVKFLKNLLEYDCIVTDRYHGMIFSVMCRKPVVVLPTNDHKIETGAKFLSEHSNFVKYCNDLTIINDVIRVCDKIKHDVTVTLPQSDIHDILK